MRPFRTYALFVLFGRDLIPKDVLLHLFFVQNLGLGPDELTLNLPAWTISIEFWINIFVYAAILILRPNRMTICVCAAVGIAACYAILMRGTGHMNTHTIDYWGILNSGLVRCLGAFLIGMIVYYIYEALPDWQPSIAFMALSLVVFVSIISVMPSGGMVGFTSPFLFGVIVVVFARGQGQLPALIARGSFLGDISFSVYLLHYPVALVFWRYDLEQTVSGMIAFPLVVILVATLVYKYFEKPTYKHLLIATKDIRARPGAA